MEGKALVEDLIFVVEIERNGHIYHGGKEELIFFVPKDVFLFQEFNGRSRFLDIEEYFHEIGALRIVFIDDYEEVYKCCQNISNQDYYGNQLWDSLDLKDYKQASRKIGYEFTKFEDEYLTIKGLGNYYFKVLVLKGQLSVCPCARNVSMKFTSSCENIDTVSVIKDLIFDLDIQNKKDVYSQTIKALSNVKFQYQAEKARQKRF